jgi:hypothetical protein
MFPSDPATGIKIESTLLAFLCFNWMKVWTFFKWDIRELRMVDHKTHKHYVA